MEAIKILIADDDRNVVELLWEIFEAEGYAVSKAYDGQAALDIHQKEKPDLIVLDVSMPIKDGMAVCREIRQQDQRVLILMLTGQRAQVNTVMGLTAGADGYVTKPFGSKEILARVKSLLRRLEH